MAFNAEAARRAGYTDQEINTYLSSKQPQSQGGINSLGTGGGLISNLLGSIAKPFARTLQKTGGAAYEVGRYIKSGGGQDLTPYQNQTNPFMNEQELSRASSTKGLVDSLKDALGVASFAVPVGGAGITKGLGTGLKLSPFKGGAISGGLFGASQEDATPESVLMGAGFGGAGGAILSKLFGGLPKGAKGIGAELEDTAQGIEQGVRRIKQPASIYGAEAEKAINETLTKYGAKGSAQAQYESLHPIVNKIEGKIQNFINENPTMVVSKESIKESFKNSLKSSLRSKDLTQKQAIIEIDGYLNDLVKASGGKGKFTNIDIGTLKNLKKVVNEDYGPVYELMQRGGSLSPRQKVIVAAWDSLDNAVKGVAPELKSLLKEESNIYKATHSLSSARSNPPTMRFAGTSLPTSVTQKGSDLLTGILRKGAGVSKGLGGTSISPEIAGRVGALGLPRLLDGNQGQEQLPQDQLGQTQPTDQGAGALFDEQTLLALSAADPKNMTKYIALFQALNSGSGGKKTVDEQIKESTKSLIADSINQLNTNPNIKTGFIQGPLQNVLGQVNAGDEATLNFNATLSNLQATIAKARGGTSFTPSEQRMLDRYTPKVGDSKQVLTTKLNNLQKAFNR